ncbi:DUF1190 domain-containing protein [Methylocystis heyeri]|uniref:DUF1190 domain-containing protein n=1 Tax=Methylocystis heyeri TaxID=391905 RepID=A0A6B8KHN8_9HYPH|nr:DUF1190 domain-containing protein [Methylocystis heyeri]QGM46485.1 DUF1190 domain-containing protein [Methylocystis heyeri]
MRSPSPSKKFLFAAAVAVAALVAFVATRRAPACGGNGKIMSTQTECRAWGFDAELCKTVVEKARAIAMRAAPKMSNSIQCETEFTDCFEAPDGAFYPKPSFCLRGDGKTAQEPTELHYLRYESDRMNRKKTREVPIN